MEFNILVLGSIQTLKRVSIIRKGNSDFYVDVLCIDMPSLD